MVKPLLKTSGFNDQFIYFQCILPIIKLIFTSKSKSNAVTDNELRYIQLQIDISATNNRIYLQAHSVNPPEKEKL